MAQKEILKIKLAEEKAISILKNATETSKTTLEEATLKAQEASVSSLKIANAKRNESLSHARELALESSKEKIENTSQQITRILFPEGEKLENAIKLITQKLVGQV